MIQKKLGKLFIRKKIGWRGFSLIEILVVVTLIGILSTIVVVASMGSTAKARDAIRKSDIGIIARTMEQYFVDNGLHYITAPAVPGYYDSTSALKIWIPGMESYFKNMPRDMKQAATPQYLANESKTGKVAADQTVILRPNGPGDRADVVCMLGITCFGTWQSQSPGGGEHWDKVDESTADEDSTYIESTIDAQWDGYTHQASGIPVGSTISNVKVCVRATYLGTYNPTPETDYPDPSYIRVIAPAIITGNVLYYSDIAIYEYNVVYGDFCVDWGTNPNGGSAWTVPDVESAQIAVRKSYNFPSRVTQAWMEVTYDSSMAPTPSPTTEPTAAPSASPGSGNYFYAYYSTDGSYYEVWARLEDLNDPYINTKPTAKCKRPVPASPPIPFNYCMSSRP